MIMNKILKAIGNLFLGIYHVIDKVIVTPISKLVYSISNFLKDHNGGLEKILNRPTTLIYISLGLAVIMFFLVDSRVINLVETEAEVINDQAVTAIYNEEAYVVEGIPETVDITLIGRKSDLYLAKQLGDHEVSLDLSGYGVGEHKVKISYKQTIDSINYKLDPSSVLVVIKEKISDLQSVSYDLLNQDKLDTKLSTGTVNLSKSEVTVKGSKDALDKVATVKALIDLNNDTLDSAGTHTIESVPLAAYDSDGHKLKNVEIVPSKISADIELVSYSSEVIIKPVVKGEFTTGYALSSVVSSVSKVTVFGDREKISEINYIPVEFDITGVTKDKEYNVTIPKPVGVSYMSDTSTKISISLGDETSKEIEGVSIDSKNLGKGLVANAVNLSEQNIIIILKGTADNLKNVDASTINAYVDLSNYSVGEHDVPVQVTSDDVRIQCFAKTTTIKIKISAS